MSAAAVRTLLARDLGTLAREVDAYPSDELLWRAVPGIANPGGTLALHLIGNVQQFIGAVLGASGFIRDRESEFATQDLTRAEVSSRVAIAATAVDAALAQLKPEQWAAEYPIAVGGRRLGTGEFVEHLLAHFAYHLGQLDYHRRMVAPESGTVDAMSLRDLGGRETQALRENESMKRARAPWFKRYRSAIIVAAMIAGLLLYMFGREATNLPF